MAGNATRCRRLTSLGCPRLLINVGLLLECIGGLGSGEQQVYMQLSDKRRAGREGVNAARMFFENNDCAFQEIGLENDFGKDAYIDIGEAGSVTKSLRSLQIKSGAS